MIRKHEFNSRWWGKPVGIVDDSAFFRMNEEHRQELLNPFDWVEYKAELGNGVELLEIFDAGFVQCDTQLPFSINLSKLRDTPSTENLGVVFADEEVFEVTADDLSSFTHERFTVIPGCGESRINERYALWTNELIKQSPDTCLRLLLNGDTQGWFLAKRGKSSRLQLTLAMLARNATISGMLLYHKACVEFAQRGHRLGEASFSVTNTAVHNMYAGLGARFLGPIGQWMWISADRRDCVDV